MIKDLPTDSHERLIQFGDAATGLRGFIAIHNTKLGPATGGTRFKSYNNDEEALADALNLSRAMTYKCAMAGVPYGGGKSVIMSSGRKDKELLEAYASVINSLNGEFTTGKDVGIGDEDIQTMSQVSPYISGRTGRQDPSIYAAIGVFIAMLAAAEKVYGSADLRGRTVAIKGLGQVGYELCKLVKKAGGRLIVADIEEDKVSRTLAEFGARPAAPDKIHRIHCDIYSPCALGREFTEASIDELDCKIICGAANNQLASPEAGLILMDRGIVYVPDYVANAGGLIGVVDGHSYKEFDHRRIVEALRVIGVNVKNILSLSASERRPTHELADLLAERIFNKS